MEKTNDDAQAVESWMANMGPSWVLTALLEKSQRDQQASAAQGESSRVKHYTETGNPTATQINRLVETAKLFQSILEDVMPPSGRRVRAVMNLQGSVGLAFEEVMFPGTTWDPEA